MIYGERIKQVRDLLDWTQEELAKRASVSQSFVAQVEANWKKAPDDFVSALVFQSQFPVSFFEQPPNEGFPLGSLLFRSHVSVPEREQRAIHRHAEMAYEIARRMLANRTVKQVPLRVPRLVEEPERAAAMARSELGLGPDVPIPNVVGLLEETGVLVISLPKHFQKCDAFSGWAFTEEEKPRRPIVVLSGAAPADRLRMSAAHELGHLIMHQPARGTAREMESEAKEFASAFLLPADAMRRELPAPLTLDSFVNLKVKWGVSIAALIVRAERLQIITQRKYRSLWAALRARGWQTHEPLSHRVAFERPRALRQIAELLYGGPRINYRKLAADVQYPEWFVKELIEAHAELPTMHKREEPQEKREGDVLLFKKER